MEGDPRVAGGLVANQIEALSLGFDSPSFLLMAV